MTVLCEGVFQFEGATTKRICQRLKPTNFKELIDINALSRPGPLQSGATEAYITGKKGGGGGGKNTNQGEKKKKKKKKTGGKKREHAQGA